MGSGAGVVPSEQESNLGLVAQKEEMNHAPSMYDRNPRHLYFEWHERCIHGHLRHDGDVAPIPGTLSR